MKGLLFVYTLTALGVFGSLRKPIIGLYVYIVFAVLRPQYLWAFAGDMSNLSLMVGVAMLLGWAMTGFGEKRVGRGGLIVALMLAFLCWTTISAALAGNSDVAFNWVIELLQDRRAVPGRHHASRCGKACAGHRLGGRPGASLYQLRDEPELLQRLQPGRRRRIRRHGQQLVRHQSGDDDRAGAGPGADGEEVDLAPAAPPPPPR